MSGEAPRKLTVSEVVAWEAQKQQGQQQQTEVEQLFHEQAKAQQEYHEAIQEARLNHLPLSSEGTSSAESRTRDARDKRLSKARAHLDEVDAKLKNVTDEIYQSDSSTEE